MKDKQTVAEQKRDAEARAGLNRFSAALREQGLIGDGPDSVTKRWRAERQSRQQRNDVGMNNQSDKPFYQSDREYHADHGSISSGMLKDFMDSRQLYYAKYIAHTLDQRSSERLAFGSACHLAVLEPDRWDRDIAIAPACDRRTKAGKAKWLAFVAESTGRIILKPEQANTIEAVRKAVNECNLASSLIQASGIVERPVRWTDSWTELACKCKPDKLLDDGTVLDLKTVADTPLRAFQKNLTKFHYGIQAVHYLEGTGARRFVWIIVNISPPHQVEIVELDRSSVEHAKAIRQTSMEELSDCYSTNDWHLQPTNITTISLPRWYQ